MFVKGELRFMVDVATKNMTFVALKKTNQQDTGQS